MEALRETSMFSSLDVPRRQLVAEIHSVCLLPCFPLAFTSNFRPHILISCIYFKKYTFNFSIYYTGLVLKIKKPVKQNCCYIDNGDLECGFLLKPLDFLFRGTFLPSVLRLAPLTERLIVAYAASCYPCTMEYEAT